MEHLDLAQFAFYREWTSYVELKKSIKDFWIGRRSFHSSVVYTGVKEAAGKPFTSSSCDIAGSGSDPWCRAVKPAGDQ